jgi:hypothetical protein
MLRADKTEIEGLLTGTPGSPGQPATLLGALADFYSTPVITGFTNQVKSLPQHGAPDTLSGWYVFVVPPRSANAPHPGLRYRGDIYAATVDCRSELSNFFCLAAVRLPAAVAPPSDVHWSWITTTIRAEYDAAALTIENGNIIGVDIAPSAATQTAGDPTLLVARSSGGIPALAPIVEQGQSNLLPLLGIAQGSAPGRWNRVFPLVLMQADAGGLADRMTVPVAGAVPYAGVDADGLSLFPRPGGPADVSGIRNGDVLISVNGQQMYSIQNLDTVVRRHRPNDNLTVVVDRDGGPTTVQLVLGYVPS